MENPEREYSRPGAGAILDAARDQARAVLPSGQRRLAGVVMSRRKGKANWNLTLRDLDAERAVTVRLPLRFTGHALHHTFCVLGRYSIDVDETDGTFRLLFRADDVDSSWRVMKPKWIQQREQVARELRENRARALFAPPDGRLARVALVTSENSTSLGDFKSGLTEINDHVDIKIFHVPLDGGSAEDIEVAIRKAGTDDPPYDLIVVARGGGRALMLDRFNQVPVLRAVADVGLLKPVLVAIGHQENFFLVEELAWRSAATPTKAGVIVAGEFRKKFARERRNALPDINVPLTSQNRARAPAYSASWNAAPGPARKKKSVSRRTVGCLAWLAFYGAIAYGIGRVIGWIGFESSTRKSKVDSAKGGPSRQKPPADKTELQPRDRRARRRPKPNTPSPQTGRQRRKAAPRRPIEAEP